MYVPTFGGSGLLHLLAAHPRLVAIFGVAATIGAVITPHAPGRVIGTADHISRIEVAIRPQIAIAEERQAVAEEEAVRIFEQNDRRQMELIVRQMLRVCGPACTDISTDRVMSDRALLLKVLRLSELDRLARAPRPTVAAGARKTERTTGGNN